MDHAVDPPSGEAHVDSEGTANGPARLPTLDEALADPEHPVHDTLRSMGAVEVTHAEPEP